METKVITSLKGVLAARDYLKGLGLAVASAIFYAACDLLAPIIFSQEPLLDSFKGINWDIALRAGIGSGLLYLGKNKFVDKPKVVTVLESNNAAKETAVDIKRVV